MITEKSSSQASQEEFLLKAKNVHGERYSYEKSHYIDETTKVEIGCRGCGRIFFQSPKIHMSHGCFRCCNTVARMSRETFELKAKSIHGERYSYEKSHYINDQTKVEIGCGVCHETFMQTPMAHLSGRGCPKCMNQTESFLFISMIYARMISICV